MRAKRRRRTTPTLNFTCVIAREEDGFVALCPQLDVASQGESVEEARKNMVEAVELFLEAASASEVRRRLSSEVYVSSIEVASAMPSSSRGGARARG
jgi:predicted RNase H-like HicB family nuclease